jgi:endonuclease YncB( thermonuclease family)
MPAACNPVIQRNATLRVSALAGLITLALLAGPEMRASHIDRSIGPSILISSPEIVLASTVVAKGQERVPTSERVPSLGDITSSAPRDLKAAVLAPDAEPSVAVARITPLDQTEIIDAMTVRAGSVTVRLAGIETPKPGDSCRRLDGLAVSCQDRALSYLQLLVRGKTVICNRAGTAPDGTEEGRCRLGETDVAEQLVRQGWAKAGVRPEERMVTAELAARRQNLGIWRKDMP